MKNDNNYTIHIKPTKQEYENLKKKATEDIRTINNYVYAILKKVKAI